MKLNPHLTPQRISDYKKINEEAIENGHRLRVMTTEEEIQSFRGSAGPKYNRPNPPTDAAVKAAQFVDKTYTWNGR